MALGSSSFPSIYTYIHGYISFPKVWERDKGLSDLPAVSVTQLVNKASSNGSLSKRLQSLVALNSFSVYKRLK